jgi:hypothetical protein
MRAHVWWTLTDIVVFLSHNRLHVRTSLVVYMVIIFADILETTQTLRTRARQMLVWVTELVLSGCCNAIRAFAVCTYYFLATFRRTAVQIPLALEQKKNTGVQVWFYCSGSPTV